jgi:AMP deaminase
MATTCRELPRLLSPGVDTPSEEDSGSDREREKSSRSSAKRKSSSSKKDKGERALLSRARLVDQSGALMYAVANVFVRPDDPNALADEETRRCLQLIDEVFRLRSKWMDASYIESSETPSTTTAMSPSSYTLQLVAGVIRVTDDLTGNVLQQPRAFSQFVDDFLSLNKVAFSPTVQSVAHKRLRWLQERFQAYLALNKDLEEASLMDNDGHTSFHSVCKIDTHVHLTAAMSPEHLVNFMRAKLERNGSDSVAVDNATGKSVTLVEAFAALKLTASDINVHALDTQSNGLTFHRFDRFNMKYNLFGSERLRDIFLKKSNLQHGQYLGELTHELLDELEDSGGTKTEWRVSVYGRSMHTWDDIAAWVNEHDLYSDCNRWVIQVPRLFQQVKGRGSGYRSFAEFIGEMFMSLL